jgi:hypothetical protein
MSINAKRFSRRTIVATVAILLMAFALPLSAAAGGPEEPDVLLGIDSASLVRTPNGLSMSLEASGLTPGNAVTIWWVIDNNPGDDILFDGRCNAGGHMVDEDGSFGAGSHLALNEPSEASCSEIALPPQPPTVLDGPALTNPQAATVALVLVNHGAHLTGQELIDQLNYPDRGCNPACTNPGMALFIP